MSGLLAGKVWQSALPRALKPLAAALADIGNDDGSSIYPSIAYISWLLSEDTDADRLSMERTVQRGLKELREMGVIVLVGRHRARGAVQSTNEYRLVESALPSRATWKETRKGKAELAVIESTDILSPLETEEVTDEAGRGDTEAARGDTTPSRGDTGVTRSVILDPSSDPLDNRDPECAREQIKPVDNSPKFAEPEAVFVRTLANLIGAEDWQTYFADAGVELTGDTVIVGVAPKNCARVQSMFAPRIKTAARAAGIATVEVQPMGP